MKDKVMKLALALCETLTENEMIELSGYLQTYANARAIDDLHGELGICEELAEELI